jgi:citronellol/citronellal dehydrogenase
MTAPDLSIFDLRGKKALVTGGSRGIGRAIALRLARAGLDIAIGAKTEVATEARPGTIHDVAREVESLGRRALAVPTDVRDEEQIARLVARAESTFGRIDVVVHNAGAIQWQPVADLAVRHLDRMIAINARAPLLLARAAIPHLRAAGGGHVVHLCPPLEHGAGLFGGWAGRTAYLTTKYAMSHLTLGLAAELLPDRIAVNGLWPRTLIDTQATRVFARWFDTTGTWRSPSIVADACHALVHESFSPSGTGRLLLDEEILAAHGVTALAAYEVPSPVV